MGMGPDQPSTTCASCSLYVWTAQNGGTREAWIEWALQRFPREEIRDALTEWGDGSSELPD